MLLSPTGAIGVCEHAMEHGLAVTIIEGGFWLNPAFEARLDCIWWGETPPVSRKVAIENNAHARKFVELESKTHSAFILTTAPFDQVIPRAP
jgi:hypothetical protein